MFKFINNLWLDITNKPNSIGMTKAQRKAKKQLDKLHNSVNRKPNFLVRFFRNEGK